MLVNANFSEFKHMPDWLRNLFQGNFTDYEPQWYDDVGSKIVQTMIINSVMPYMNFGMAILLPKFFQYLDSRGNVYKTKKTSMAAFKVSYSGSDYVIHFKYSLLLNVVFVAMLYGAGLPILFPIAAFTIMNMYISERFIVAWAMKLPPALGDTLTQNAISILKYAPFMFIVNAYWMLGNPQIFQARYTHKNLTTDAMPSEHVFEKSQNHKSPLFWIIAFGTGYVIIRAFFENTLGRYGFAM